MEFIQKLDPPHKLRDTIQEHARIHELGIAHGHNGHNHNEAEHIH